MEEPLEKAGREGKCLTFSLGKEQYGISILNVIEIIGMMPVTAMPQAPDFVKGVINLRGNVIPVVELRKKICMKSVESTARTCIIVVEGHGRKGVPLKTGIVVDAVSEVLQIKESDIEDAPTFDQEIKSHAILGMAKEEGGGGKILLDIKHALEGSEFDLTGNAA